jgi:ATP-binding cassette, subfamily B, bacterial PglK
MIFNKIYVSIPDSLKVNLPFVLLAIFVASIFETFSIAIIFPLIGVFSDTSRLDTMVDFTGLSSKDLIVLTVLLIVLVNILKICIIKWQLSVVTKFSFELQYKLAKSISDFNIGIPYAKFFERGPSELIADVSVIPGQLLNLVYLPFFLLVSEVLVCILVAGLVLYVEPGIGMVAILTVGISMLVLTKIYKLKLEKYSAEKVRYEKSFLGLLNTTFNAYKEIKIYDLDLILSKLFKENANKIVNCSVKQQININTPRIYIEFLFLLVIVLYISLLYAYGQSNFLATLGLVCASAFRLLPSANRITTAIQSISAGMPILSSLPTIKRERTESSAHQTFIESISVTNASYKIPNSNKILQIENLDLKAGKWYAIRGRSGAGKTTLLNLLTGFLPFDNGNYSMNGMETKSYNLLPSDFAYVTQNFFIFNGSIKSNIAIGDDGLNLSQYCKALEISGLKGVIDEISEGDDFIVGENGSNLSGGQRQRLAIARAIYTGRNFLVLDEGTSGLDSKTEISLIESLKRVPGLLVLLVSHNDQNLKYCDHTYEIDDGKVYQKN